MAIRLLSNESIDGTLEVGTFTVSGSGIVAAVGMTLQVDSGNVSAITIDNVGSTTFSGYTYFPNYLFHAGDTDTRIQFTTGTVTLRGDTSILLDGPVTANESMSITGDITLGDDLNFDTNGFADISNIGTGAMRFKPSGQTLALTLTGTSATFAGSITTTSTSGVISPLGVFSTASLNTNVFRFIKTGNVGYNWQFPATDSIRFGPDTGSDKKLSFTNTGAGNFLVGIGTDSPSSYDGESDDLVIFNSTTPGITIATDDTASRGAIRFADGTSGNAAYIGGLEYNHNGDYMSFRTAGTEKMRISSTGTVTLTGDKTIDTTNTLRINAGGGILYLDSATDVLIRTNGTTERMRITSGGQILINRNGQPPITNSLYGNMVLQTNADTNFLRIRFDVGTTPYWGLTKLNNNNFAITGLIGSTWNDHVFEIQQSTGNVGIGGAPTVSLEIAKAGARMKMTDGTNQLNMGLWDGVNYRFEGDANRPMFFTSYQGNIKFGISGSTTMTVQSSNVGIGTTSPLTALDVSGTSAVNVGVAFFLESSTTAYLASGFNNRPTNTMYGINTANTYVGTRLSHAGNTEFFHGIVKGANNGEMTYVWQGYNGTAYQQFGAIDCYGTGAGSLVMSGDVVAYSDKKLKKNIKTLDGSKVYKMRGVSFDRIDTGKSSSGVIAQEMQEVAPELVNESDDTLGVAYGNLTGYLIEAIKELKAEIEELKNKPCNCK